MKEIYKYWGHVNKYNPDPDHSFVTFKDIETGELWKTDAISSMLAEHGLTHENDEFEVTIVKDDTGEIKAIMTKLEPQVPPGDFNI